MCHPSEYVDPRPRPGARRREVSVELPEREALPARLAVPEADLRGAVVIVTDIFGANAFYRALADRLAASGFAALLPDIFFREGKLSEPTRELAYQRRALLDDERALRDLGLCCDWLHEQAALPPRPERRVGALGFCLGGNLVLHLACRRDDLATVAYYAFPAGLPAPKAAPAPIEMVDRLRGPILAFWGDRDEKVGMENVDAFARTVRRADLDYEQHVYPAVDHGFLAGLDDEANPAYPAASDSWRRTLDFLTAHLGRSRAGKVA